MAKKAKKGTEDLDEDLDEGSEDESTDEGDEEEEAPAKSKKGKAKGKDKSKGKSKKAAKSDDDDEGYVSINDLAEEAEINAQSARVKLREAELEKPEGGRWRWKEGSKGLKSARKALGL